MTESFENHLWLFENQTDETKVFVSQFDNIDVELAIYENVDYDTYVTWLGGSSA